MGCDAAMSWFRSHGVLAAVALAVLGLAGAAAISAAVTVLAVGSPDGADRGALAGAAERDVIERFYNDAWSAGDISFIDDIFAPDYVLHMPGGRTFDRDIFKLEIPEFRAAFPDLKLETDEYIFAPNRVIARATWSGTHTGEGFGLEPTGIRFETTAIYIYRFENGTIVESWAEWDALGYRQQLGLLPT